MPTDEHYLAAEYFALPKKVSRLSEIDFTAPPDATGRVASLDRSTSQAPFWEGGPADNFAARYTALLAVETAGRYSFYLRSDDGSALSLDGARVIDNGGLHGTRTRQVTLDLEAGTYPLEVLYFERGGKQALKLNWSGPDTGGARQTLEGAALGQPPVEPVNTPPEARDDTAETQAETPVLIDVRGNDSDADGDALSITSLGAAEHGRVEIENGGIRYTPDAGFDGTDAFAYTISDGRGGSDTATVTVDVAPPMETAAGFAATYFRLPAGVSGLSEIDFGASPDAAATVAALAHISGTEPFWEGGPADNFAARYTATLSIETSGRYSFYLASDDGSALSLDGAGVIDNDGLHGTRTRQVTLDLEAGTHPLEVLYFERGGEQTLTLDWSGPDTGGARRTLEGAALGQPPAEPVNTPPEAGDDTVDGTLSDGMLHVAPDDILANDSDADGDALSILSLEGAMRHGDEIMVTAPVVAGIATFGYTLGDGRGGTDTATVTVRAPDMTPPGGDAEIEAFVARVTSEPDGHAHPGDPGKAAEHDQLLDLVPRSASTHVAIGNGDWFDPSNWYQGRIPDAGAKVLIPREIALTYDGESAASLFTVRIDGALSFATDADTGMLVDTLVVSPSGRLEIGTAENPVQAGVTARIVIADNGDIDTGWDPSLLSRGVISHGQAEIHGARKTSFLEVADAPMAGDTTLRLAEAPEGWQTGDTLVLTGTHKQGWTWDNALRRVVHRESEDEEVTITAIDGATVSIDRPLAHDHDTPRADLAAYVANMTRNVTVTSEGGADLPVHQRGHVMFMHSDKVDVRYAAFDDLGRTDKSVPAADVETFSQIAPDSNVKGRYSLHFHRTGTEDQDNPAIALGNAATGSPGWAYTHHSSHADMIENVAFDAFGAGFAAENGDETGSWLRNLAIRSEGVAYGESEVKLASDLARHDNGRTGEGFFFAGRLVEAAENVAANTTHGFVWMHRSAPTEPLSRNLDQPEVAYGAETMGVSRPPIQGFRDNEAFGTQAGVIVVKSDHRQEHDVRTVMDGFLNWETSQGMDITYTSHYTIKDVDLIGTRNTAPVADAEFGFRFGGNAFDIVVNGMKIEGFDRGVDFTRNDFTFDVRDSDVDHVLIDMDLRDVGTAYAGFDPARHAILTSGDLTPGRLDFDMRGDLALSYNESLRFDGIKSDSIGSRDRQFASLDDRQGADFHQHVRALLARDGYYQTADGARVMLVEDFIADRATGALKKIAHVVTLEMSGQRLADLGAADNGLITLGGPAPQARGDAAATGSGAAVRIDVLANDSDPDGGGLRVDGLTDPTHGEVSLRQDGQLLYKPDFGFSGSDSFVYWAADEEGNFAPAEVTVEVWPDLA